MPSSIYVVASVDIGFAVTLLARFSDHPSKIRFDSLRRLARYLHMTKDWGIIYWRPTPLASMPSGSFIALESDSALPTFPQPVLPTTLAGYVDAAHATDLTTRRSISGLAFKLCGGPIAFKSKVQSTVFTSSTEAEFIAAVHAAKIAKYIRSILHELGHSQPGPTVLYEDNKAAIFDDQREPSNASRSTYRYPALCYRRMESKWRDNPMSHPRYHKPSGCPHKTFGLDSPLPTCSPFDGTLSCSLEFLR